MPCRQTGPNAAAAVGGVGTPPEDQTSHHGPTVLTSIQNNTNDIGVAERRHCLLLKCD